MSDYVQSPVAVRETLVQEQDTAIVPLSMEDILIPGVADKHPRDMPEMAFVIAFCFQYNEAVGNLNFSPEELEDAIVSTEPVDLVERVHRYFLRNVLNSTKIIDKRYWVNKMKLYLYERIEQKEFSLDYNPFDRIDMYHDLSNFEKVIILKDLVMWQFKKSEKIQTMWQFKESEKIQNLSDHENIVRPVEVEVLGADSKGSTYFYLGVGARIYRETPSVDSAQQCIWEALTTTLQDLEDLIYERVEIDPDRSEKERLLYKRIVEELIPEIESQNEESDDKNEKSEKSEKNDKNDRYKRYEKSQRVPVVEETDQTDQIDQIDQADIMVADVADVNTESPSNADESSAEPILSVSMWSVTRPSTNSQPANTVHDIKCDSNDSNTTFQTTVDSGQNIQNTEIDTFKDNQILDDDDVMFESDYNGIIEIPQQEKESSHKNSGPSQVDINGQDTSKSVSSDNQMPDDDVMMFETDDYNDIIEISQQEKEPSQVQNVDINDSIDSDTTVKPKIDKGKGVLRYEEQSQMVENGSPMSHGDKNITNVTKSSIEVSREIFRPGPEELLRLEWSLNHKFFEQLEIFGEDSDSELSECCDACMMEVDRTH